MKFHFHKIKENSIHCINGYFRLKGLSGFGLPSVEYNRLSFPAATQTYGEAAYQGIHAQSEYENLFL